MSEDQDYPQPVDPEPPDAADGAEAGPEIDLNVNGGDPLDPEPEESEET